MKRFFFIVLILSGISCTQKEMWYKIEGYAQGSTYQVQYIGVSIPHFKASIDSILEVIDKSMSTYRDDSLISRINQGDSLAVDTHFRKVFETSQKIWAQSEGLFDPTVGILVEAWGFGKEAHHQKPTDEQLQKMLLQVGLDKLSIDKRGFIIRKKKGIMLNFNAIAQGYTVDVIADFMKQKGIRNFVVEVGGELYVSGTNTQRKTPWRLGIDNPLQKPGERTLIAVVQLQDKGLATSGNYRKLWIDPQTGQKYVHSLNPHTGKPERSDILSATVIASTTMEADAYATAFMVMGLERTQKFVAQHPEIQVYINYSDGSQMKTFVSEGFHQYLVESFNN